MPEHSDETPIHTLPEQLARVEHSGLIRLAQLEPEIEYLFRHALVQDAAYWSLLREQRKKIHLSTGEAIEALYPDRLAELASVLAHHFNEGGDPARAIHYYRLAGDAAAVRYANDEAIMAFEQAITLAEKHETPGDQLAHFYSQKGRAEELSGHYDDALATYEAMEAAGKARGDRSIELESLNHRATIFSTYTTHVDPDRGIAFSEKALALAREIGDEPAQAKILWNLLLVYYALGKHAESRGYGEESLAIARRLGLDEQAAYTLHDLGGAMLGIGDVERAWEFRAEARAMWRVLGNKAMLADNLISSAMPLVVMGQYEEGLAMAQEGLAISQSIGNAWGQSYAYMGLGYIYSALGDFSAALHSGEQSVVFGEAAGFGFGIIYSRCVQALVLSYVGQYDEALALLDAARARADAGLQGVAVLPTIFEIPVRLRMGDLAGIEALLDEASKVGHWDDPTPPLLLNIARARFYLLQGKPEEAIRASEQEALPGEQSLIHANIFVFEVNVIKAQALLALERQGEARSLLDDLIGEYERTGAHYYRWEALAVLAEVCRALGDQAAEKNALAAAREEIAYIIARIDDARLEASFRARADVKAVLGA